MLIFSSLGYSIEFPDEIKMEGISYDGWINWNDKTVIFTQDALDQENTDAFGYTIPFHELLHALCECNWHAKCLNGACNSGH